MSKSKLVEKPDIVVHLPDNRKVVIDSKVSLNDYSMFLNADNDQSKDLAKKIILTP